MVYVDPGSGTLIWELIIAAFFLGAVFSISKIKGWVLSRIEKAKALRATKRNPAGVEETSPPSDAN